MNRPQRQFEVVPLQEVLKRADDVDGMRVMRNAVNVPNEFPHAGRDSRTEPREIRSKILCIDDEVTGLKLRKQLLELQGFEVLVAADGPTGLEITRRESVHLVILDYNMPGMNGEQVAIHLRAQRPHIPILLLSAWRESIPQTLFSMVDSFIEKGGQTALLVEEVKRLTGEDPKPRPIHEQ
jgi:CheY-like chemotaxis protein